MSKTFDHGPLQEFEVTWASGHVETVRAHQVSHQGGAGIFGGPETPEVVQFHGEVEGHWLLVLRALGSDLRTVRNLSQAEQRG